MIKEKNRDRNLYINRHTGQIDEYRIILSMLVDLYDEVMELKEKYEGLDSRLVSLENQTNIVSKNGGTRE